MNMNLRTNNNCKQDYIVYVLDRAAFTCACSIQTKQCSNRQSHTKTKRKRVLSISNFRTYLVCLRKSNFTTSFDSWAKHFAVCVKHFTFILNSNPGVSGEINYLHSNT